MKVYLVCTQEISMMQISKKNSLTIDDTGEDRSWIMSFSSYLNSLACCPSNAAASYAFANTILAALASHSHFVQHLEQRLPVVLQPKKFTSTLDTRFKL